MRTNEQATAKSSNKSLFGVDLHDFIVREATHTNVELAAEYGVTVGDVRKLKKQLEKN